MNHVSHVTMRLPALLAALLTPWMPLDRAMAQEKAPTSAEVEKPERLGPWGRPVDPDRDCGFDLDEKGGRLVITVPGGETPHDLSAELGNMNSPRVLQAVAGDFTITVCIDGAFDPGGDSSQQGRSGYTGAGILVLLDDRNYVRLERATLQWPNQQPRPYLNFELRVDARLRLLGNVGVAAPDAGKATWLRLRRSGNRLTGEVSHDGTTWSEVGAGDLPDGWSSAVLGGVAAVSTSKQDFTPAYSGLVIEDDLGRRAVPVPEEEAAGGKP